MSLCCSGFCAAAEHQFDARRAARDLRRYRKKGPAVTTRLLRDGVKAAGPVDGTLLDVGAGIGALTFELLEVGLEGATSIDASEAYVAAGRDEASRRERRGQVAWHYGDFVSLGRELPRAGIVTLDRVVCCYPAFEPLLGEALAHARRCLALSYPRNRWYVRGVISLENTLRRVRRNPFRAFVHAPSLMEAFVRARGFDLVSRHSTLFWCADVYSRAEA